MIFQYLFLTWIIADNAKQGARFGEDRPLLSVYCQELYQAINASFNVVHCTPGFLILGQIKQNIDGVLDNLHVGNTAVTATNQAVDDRNSRVFHQFQTANM